MTRTGAPADNNRTKQRILAVAKKRFGHYGFRKVTISEIANDLGMGKASLYYYFATKEDLFREVVKAEQEEFITGIRNILQLKIPSAEKIRRYVHDRFHYMNHLLNLHVLTARSDAKMGPMLRSLFREFAEQEVNVLQDIIKEGKVNRQFAVNSPRLAAETFLHTLQGLRLRFLRTFDSPAIEMKDYHPLKPEMMYITEIFVRGMARNSLRFHSSDMFL